MIPPKKTSACVFVPRVGSRSPSPSFPVFYLFINHRLSQREKKGARYFSCFISNWYRLVVSFFFFFAIIPVAFYFIAVLMAGIENGKEVERKKEGINIRICV
jgi:hypothetical protein